MSKIPQRVREPPSYAKIFAKHKANQPRKEETADEVRESEGTALERLSGPRVEVERSQGMSRIQPVFSRIPLYGTNHFQGQYYFKIVFSIFTAHRFTVLYIFRDILLNI